MNQSPFAIERMVAPVFVATWRAAPLHWETAAKNINFVHYA